ncbi:MAG: META domain-containing protein, partial [Candidatus Promineifilaceae bacterium]
MPWVPTGPVPTIKIVAVVEDYLVVFETHDFPEDEVFTVTMGEMYTRGVNGIEVGSFNSSDGTLWLAFTPDALYGRDRIAIRASTDHQYPYYAFNWFWNNTAIAPEYTALQGMSADDIKAELEGLGAEGLLKLDSLEAPLSEGVAAEPMAETEEAPAAEEVTEETEAEVTEETATTEETEAETTEGVGGAEAVEEAVAGSELTGTVWQWVGFSDPVQGALTIDMPEQYTVEFMPEGLAAVKADCNNGSGTYIADEEGGLDIAIGIVTTAACAPESLSDQFLQYLGDVVIYSFDDTGLILDLPLDSGTLTFVAAEEAEVPAEEVAEEPAEETTEEAAEETTEEAVEEPTEEA